MPIDPVFDRTGLDKAVQVRDECAVERTAQKFRREQLETGKVMRHNDNMRRRTAAYGGV